MAETRRKFDADFKEGAVRLVRETGKPIAQVARELRIVPGTLENWVAKDRRQREGGDGRLSEDERAELARLRRGAGNNRAVSTATASSFLNCPGVRCGTRVHLRLRLAGPGHRRLVEIGGGLLDLLTIAGLAAGLRERLAEPARPRP